LGATACFILTGQTPHDTNASIHEAVRRVAQDPPRDPRALDPTLPKALAAVLGKAYHSDPMGRYANAQEFGEDLRRWFRGEPVSAGTPGVWTIAARWVARHPVRAAWLAGAAVFTLSLAATGVTVWWLGLRPSRVAMGGTFSEASLYSAFGKGIKTWHGTGTNSIGSVTLVNRPAALGGGRLVVLEGSIVEAALPEEPVSADKELLAYSVADLGHPAWRSGHDAGFRMPALPSFTLPARYASHAVDLVDVFPESPGPELVAVFRNVTGSPACVRIYDLNGRVLWEAWHNGWIHSAHWLPGPGLLLLSGVNSEALWADRGVTVPGVTWPQVVMAVKPQFGTFRGWITTPGTPGDLDPEWYKCLWPPELYAQVASDLNEAEACGLSQPPGQDPRSVAKLTLGDAMFIVDAQGTLHDRWTFSSGVQRRRATGVIPVSLEEVRLVDLPPVVVAPARATQSQPH
jgi:hypothetical protein